MAPLIEEARQRARETLGRATSSRGFKASALARGYPHVWSRDTGIIALGAAASGDAQGLAAFRTSLDTLGAHQSALGLVPLNVEADTGIISTENAGATDSNLWFILAHYMHFLATRDTDYLRLNWPAIERALLWLRYQDMNECGLLEVPEAGDWMDLLAVRYNVLYDNVLWYAALRAFVQLAQAIDGRSASGNTEPAQM